MHELTLPVRTPFDFTRSLSFTCSFRPTAGEQHVDQGRLTKAFAIDGRAIVAEIAETTHDDRLTCTLRSDRPIDDELARTAIDRVRFHLSLDDELAPFYALGRSDPAYAPLIEALHGQHHVKFASVFEIACWAVLGQRTPMASARKTKDAIVARFGPKLTLGDRVYPAFPEAAAIVEAGDALSEVVRDRRRADAINAIARALLEVDDAFLRTAPFAEVEEFFTALPRIGPWSSAFILFRGLGRMERLTLRGGPIADCARRVYGESTSDRDVIRIADRYGAWCGYWSLYLRIAA